MLINNFNFLISQFTQLTLPNLYDYFHDVFGAKGQQDLQIPISKNTYFIVLFSNWEQL